MMRKTVEFEGDAIIQGREKFVSRQVVRVIGRAQPYVDEDEDRWTVQLADGSKFHVDGEELEPHPEARETNVEFIARLMDFSPVGPLMQAFVIEAIDKYAQLIQQMPTEQREKMDGGLIGYGAWANCANKAREALAERLK